MRVAYAGYSINIPYLQIIKPSLDPDQRGRPSKLERDRAEAEVPQLDALLREGFKTRFSATLSELGIESSSSREAQYHLRVFIGAAHVDATRAPAELKFIVEAHLSDLTGNTVWIFSARVPPAPIEKNAREELFSALSTALIGQMRRDGLLRDGS